MRPALSVILFTTLAGAGQGLLLMAYASELCALARGARAPADFLSSAGYVSAGLAVLGLIASFFHLGHPERAWRAAAMWRTSWLSREVIVLPGFIALALIFGFMHQRGVEGVVWAGFLAALAAVALFVCTAKIYMCLKFLREWSHPLTMMNFVLLGLASGATLATVLAAVIWPVASTPMGIAAMVLTVAAGAGRVMALVRNAQLRPLSTPQSATGIKSPRVTQVSKGFTGPAFNTREFFHGASHTHLFAVKWGFLLLTFALPVYMIAQGVAVNSLGWLVAAGLVQYLGLLGERWYFFAEANHPQNIYYQSMA